MPPSCPPEAAWHRQACHEVRGLQQAKWASDVAARHGGGHLSNRYLPPCVIIALDTMSIGGWLKPAEDT